MQHTTGWGEPIEGGGVEFRLCLGLLCRRRSTSTGKSRRIQLMWDRPQRETQPPRRGGRPKFEGNTSRTMGAGEARLVSERGLEQLFLSEFCLELEWSAGSSGSFNSVPGMQGLNHRI